MRTRFRDRYLFLLVHLKGLLVHGFRRTAYGQWAEDILIGGLVTSPHGTYVDVGAFHPMHYSNTYLLYKRGWSGVVIDPNPSARTLFRLHRPRDVFMQVGVGVREPQKPYYVFNHQSCNTFSEAHRDRMLARSFMRQVDTIPVDIEPLSTLLERAHVLHVGVLNIDVEGMNLAVLESNDWARVVPKLICVEDDDLTVGSATVESPIHAYLSERGYTLRARAGQSSIYTHD
jgi:FkbM family methyltransferase